MGVVKKNEFSIIVVGAGPSGLLLALLLAKRSISVTVLERSGSFDGQPRGTFHALPATHEFRRAGIFDEVAARGFHTNGVAWRYLDGTRIASIKSEHADLVDRQISLPLDELVPLIASQVEKQPSARILLSHEVTCIGQDDQHAWVDAGTPDGEKRFSAAYIVGCDGASSKIRRDLFGRNFPGYTWDKQIVATNVRWPAFSKLNWETSSNFIVHPEHFLMVAQMTKDGLLRITYGEDSGLTSEEMLARQPEKFKTFLVGSPEPNEYEVINFSPYKIHQRLAERMRVGRFLLAADAAHLCNPFGGLGLAGGFADIGGLFDCLYGVYAGRADESILDKYDEVRRNIYRTVTNPTSSSNLRRLWEPEEIENDDFIKTVKQMENNRELAKQVSKGVVALMHDFTQYYRPSASGG